jgi:hypothetical protein
MSESDRLAELAAANQRIKELEAENQQLREAAARVVKHHDQGTMAAKSDMDGFRVKDINVQIHSDGSRATVFRVATGYFGRGYVSLDEVPLHLRQDLYAVPWNDHRDAFFRSQNGAERMIDWMRQKKAST